MTLSGRDRTAPTAAACAAAAACCSNSRTLCSISLSAKIEHHLKAATNKGIHHRIRNVDFIYMINLDKRPEKFESSLKQLLPYGINPYRFSAVNGWELSLADINDVGLKFTSNMTKDLMGTYYPLDGTGPCHEIMATEGRTYFCHCICWILPPMSS